MQPKLAEYLFLEMCINQCGFGSVFYSKVSSSCVGLVLKPDDGQGKAALFSTFTISLW